MALAVRASAAAAACIVVTAGLLLGGIAQRERLAHLPETVRVAAASVPTRSVATLPAAPSDPLLAEAISTSNVYARPERGAPLVAVLPGGQRARVTGRSQDVEWLYVTVPPTSDVRGWVAVGSLRIEREVVAALPVLSGPVTSTPTPPVVADGALPDPALAGVIVRPGGQLEVRIENAGAVALVDTTFTLSVGRVGGDEISNFRIGPASLQAGAAALAAPPLMITEPGAYRLELKVEREGADADESNNVIEAVLGPATVAPAATATSTPAP